MNKAEQHIQDILDVLHGHPEPMNSADIADFLNDEGNRISDRTVRYYLNIMDRDALTRNTGRRGRILTPKGHREAEGRVTPDKTGFLSAKIDQMTYAMTFDPQARTGTVVVNTTIIRKEALERCLDKIERVFRYRYAMGTLAALIRPGEHSGNLLVPKGHLGFTTVCSVTINGVLLKHGIPSHSRFGGILELVNGKARGFSAIINYDGTTIDPLEVFIRGGMTNYIGAITTGNGHIGASFREIPADSRTTVLEIAQQLDAIGLGGIFEVARRNRPLLGIPVSTGRAGMILIGGLNPASIFEESGFRVQSFALSGLMPYEQLLDYRQLRKHLKNSR